MTKSRHVRRRQDPTGQQHFQRLKSEFIRVFGDIEPRGSQHIADILAGLAQVSGSRQATPNTR